MSTQAFPFDTSHGDVWRYVTDELRFVDPLFSLAVGVSAAALRIQREQREQYPSQDSSFSALWTKGRRMGAHYFGIDGDRNA